MILICSNSEDYSTAQIVKWLHYLGTPYRLLLEDTPLQGISMNNGETFLQLTNGDCINLANVRAYWYRRGASRFQIRNKSLNVPLPELAKRTKSFLDTESASVATYIEFLLGEKKQLNDLKSSSNVNKLVLCDLAARAGFKTPVNLLTGSKSELKRFMGLHGQAITKPIERQMDYITNQFWLPMYTELITDEVLDALPEAFQVSLFQKKIEKKYELRVFCMDGKHYAMAIFSQRDGQTAIDFRKYNTAKPNRNLPFRLPAEIAEKINRFLQLSGYKSGSIDLLVDKQNEYHFLEINPVGQFGMVSLPCNYQLEKKLAQYLSA